MVLNKNSGVRPKIITIEQEEEILVRTSENSNLDTSRLETFMGIGKSTVSRVFHGENLFSHHFTPVQNLLPEDLPARLEYCRNL